MFICSPLASWDGIWTVVQRLNIILNNAVLDREVLDLKEIPASL